MYLHRQNRSVISMDKILILLIDCHFTSTADAPGQIGAKLIVPVMPVFSKQMFLITHMTLKTIMRSYVFIFTQILRGGVSR